MKRVKKKVNSMGYVGSSQEFHRISTIKNKATKSQKRKGKGHGGKASDNIYYVNFGQFWRNKAWLRAWVGGLVCGIIGVWLLFVFVSWLSYLTGVLGWW